MARVSILTNVRRIPPSVRVIPTPTAPIYKADMNAVVIQAILRMVSTAKGS